MDQIPDKTPDKDQPADPQDNYNHPLYIQVKDAWIIAPDIPFGEQTNGDYAKTILRQFLCDAFDYYFYSELVKSKDETLAAISAKSIKEIAYHLRHSSSWVERLGDGTEESHTRMQNALDELWRFTGEMFEMNEVDSVLIKEGITVDLKSIQSKWESKVKEILERATLIIPTNAFMQRGSRDAKHTEHLGFILAEMQSLPQLARSPAEEIRLYPIRFGPGAHKPGRHVHLLKTYLLRLSIGLRL